MKRLSLILVIFTLILSAMLLSACDIKGFFEGLFGKDPETHEHIEGDWIIDVEATVDGEGSKHTECEVCGAILQTLTLEKLTPSTHLEFTLNEDGESYSLTGIGMGLETEIVIPSVYEGKPVVSIGDYALSHVYLYSSITPMVRTVRIPSSIKYISDSAFDGCYFLADITVDGGNEKYSSIDGNLYSKDGSELIRYAPGKEDTTFVFGEGVVSIADYAFGLAGNLEKICIPKNITYVGSSAFWGCTSLEELTVEEGNPKYHSEGNCIIDTESKVLICGCPVSVIPSDGSVTSIGIGAFSQLTNLISIEIPSTVTSIGDMAFYACMSLQEVKIPESVTSMGESVFCYCSSLKSVNVPEGVKSIGDYMFFSCAALSEIVLPSSVESIGYAAFYGCDALKTLAVAKENTTLHSEGNCIIETASGALLAGCNASVIPSGVTSIGQTAFCSCTRLVEIVIPEGVTSIANDAFYSCTSLERVYLPSTLTYIEEYAFEACTSLTDIYFAGTSEEWEKVQRDEEWDAYCGGEYTVHFGSLEFELDEGGEGYLVSGIGTWSDPDVVIPSVHEGKSVVGIGEYAFYGCELEIESVVLPESVTSIGEGAFCFCYSLKSVAFPERLGSIGVGAFYACTSLEAVEIPDCVIEIGESAFGDCASLKTVKIGSGVESIGASAFAACVELEGFEVDVENTNYVSVDGNLLSKDGTVLVQYIISKEDESFVVPEGVKVIDNWAFGGAMSLKSVTLPSSVESIGDSAFYYCISLTEIRYFGNSESWEKIEKGEHWDSGFDAAKNDYYQLGYKVIYIEE